MKVILKKDVVPVGEMGETVNVKNGYARNFLIPQDLAIPATKGNLEQAEALKRRREEIRVVQAATFQEIVQILSGKTVVIEARVNELGHLYGSVGPREVADALNTTYNTTVDERYVVMPEHIKEPGTYDVTLTFNNDLSAPVKVEVMPQGREYVPSGTEDVEDQTQPPPSGEQTAEEHPPQENTQAQQ